MNRAICHFGLIFMVVFVYAIPHNTVSAALSTPQAMQSLTALGADIIADPETGNARFISFPIDQISDDHESSRAPRDAEIQARSFLQAHGVW